MAKKATPSISSRKSPSQARSTQLVSDILEAAFQVLTEEGAQGFTTSRVAERAGVSVGSLYQYFPNKAALLFRLQTDEWRQNSTRLRELLADPSSSPLERLRRFVHVFVRSECEEIGLRHALGDAAPGYKDAPQEPRVAGTAAIEAFLLELLPSAPPDTRMLAGEMVMMTLGKVGKAISERRFSPETSERYARELADMLGAYLERLARDVQMLP
ncbi:MAG: TetR family transcriptional regulator [Cystobacter sp.]